MIFLTGAMGEGKSYSIKEYLQTKDNPIYIIDDSGSYNDLAEQSNVFLYKTKDWKKKLKKRIKKTENVIVVTDGNNEDIYDVVYDIKEEIEVYNRYGIYISTLDDERLIQQGDLHFIIYRGYRRDRIDKKVKNPLITDDISTSYFFQVPVDDNGNKKINFFNLDYLASASEMSEIWNLSPGYIKNLCAKNKIKCKKISNTWIIDKRQRNPKHF